MSVIQSSSQSSSNRIKREAVPSVAPQPVTMSLSNGHHGMNAFPPPITTTMTTTTTTMHSGVPLINFGGNLPPIHLPFFGGIATNKIPSFGTVIGGDRSDEQSASSYGIDTIDNGQNGNNQNGQNGQMFPMNVTPSVSMMGGPPLASM